MKKLLVLLLIFSTIVVNAQVQKKPGKINGKVLLPNGWSLSPAGKSLPLGDLPLNMVVSSSRKLIAVTNNGQSTQSIQLIDVVHEKILDDITIPASWYGLKFSNNDQYLY